MRGKMKKGIVLFLVGMLVMQLVFNEGGAAKAAHSDTGTISHVNGIRVVIEANTNRVSACYCIARNLYCTAGDAVTSNKTLDANTSLLLNTAFLYGFNVNTTISQIQSMSRGEYDKTQNIIWAIMEGKFDGTLSSIQNATDCDKEMLKKIAYLVTAPSYVNGQENIMKWNQQTNQFELTLTNTAIEGQYSANASLQVDTTTLPSGVQAVVEGENLKLTSTEEFTELKNIKLYKRAADKGQLVAWDNGNGTKQPQITLDYDEPPVSKVMDLNIKTESKPQQVTVPDEPVVEAPEPSQQPEVEEPVQENQTVDMKNNNMNEVKEEDAKQMLDDVPKTADSSNIALVYKLMGASMFTMIGLGVIYTYKRRKI